MVVKSMRGYVKRKGEFYGLSGPGSKMDLDAEVLAIKIVGFLRM